MWWWWVGGVSGWVHWRVSGAHWWVECSPAHWGWGTWRRTHWINVRRRFLNVGVILLSDPLKLISISIGGRSFSWELWIRWLLGFCSCWGGCYWVCRSCWWRFLNSRLCPLPLSARGSCQLGRQTRTLAWRYWDSAPTRTDGQVIPSCSLPLYSRNLIPISLFAEDSNKNNTNNNTKDNTV